MIERRSIDSGQPSTDPCQFAELHCHSYFSLLDGASSPEALAARARALGITALALTDHDSLAGAVRFQQAARAADLQAILGAEVTLDDGGHLTLLAATRTGYANLSRLVTAARLDQMPASLSDDPAAWPGKVAPALSWARLAELNDGVIALSGCRQGPVAAPLLAGDAAAALQAAGRLRDIFDDGRCYVEVQHHQRPDDDRLNHRLTELARRLQLPLVATGNVHYATQAESRLRDAFIAIQHNESLTQARRAGRLPLNSNYALSAPALVTRRFQHAPDAVVNTLAIAERCQAVIDFSDRRLPAFATPDGCSEFAYLYQLCHKNLPRRYPDLTPAVLSQLAHELAVIQGAELAGYFLIVWDIMRFARAAGIRCQGRGSAANSIVAYLLEITSIDPLQHDLLFERFLSADKFTTPDIDIDFAADRREEVIQYVYERYGREHAAMVCNVVTYRARSALRDLGKALDFPPATLERLAKQLDTNSPQAAADQLAATFPAAGEGEQIAPLTMLFALMRQIDGCPRHLAIHSGGMIITAQPLATVVPLEPATMPGRIVAQWDKESVEDAGLIKIDLLGLRTLGLITQALGYIAEQGAGAPDLDALALDDPVIYRMLQRGDTIGAFQVESRAQQQMLPRLKPACFEDIIVEVAIVRPGPIQGGAVHPYLRRRAGEEAVAYLHPSLEPVLKETLGVLLFQEQAIRVAISAAGFSPGEADLLRRALSRNRSDEAMAVLAERFLEGAQASGMDGETAGRVFDQLRGFAGYGFCKSHAAGFALIAYQTLWLKRYHPAAFTCALLNQQPMGFYSTEVILGDARRHGVETLPPDIARSDWDYRLERDGGKLALRMGLVAVDGLGEAGGARIVAARNDAPFADLRDLCIRTRLDRDTLRNLIRAGVLDALGERRALLWQLGEIDYRPDEFDLPLPAIAASLPQLAALEETAWEYELLGHSAQQQIMVHYRPALRRARVLSTWQVKQAKAGQRARVAGLIVVRQRPSTAKGILFMSLEDESGLLDLVVKPPVYERLRLVLRGEPLVLVEGLVQRAGRVASLLVADAQPLVRGDEPDVL